MTLLLLVLQSLPEVHSNWFWSVDGICTSQLAMLRVHWC